MNHDLALPFDLETPYVEDIAQTKAGKHQFFVANLRNGH